MSKCAVCNCEVNDQFPAKCLKCSTILCDCCAIDNKFLCNDCRGDASDKYRNEIQSVRRSYLELYKICPHAFNLKVCKGVDTVSNVYAQIGTKLHEMFDKTAKGGFFGRVSRDAIKADLIQEWTEFYKTINEKSFDNCQRKLTTEEFKEQQFRKGLANIDGFLESCSELPPPWKSEETIAVTIPNTTMKATMTFDRINRLSEDEYELIDYKTGKVYVGKQFVEDLQPALYIAGVEENYGIKISKFTFIFTGEGKIREYFRIGDDTFNVTVGKKVYQFSVSEKLAEVSRIMHKIERGEFDIPSDLHPWYCQHECELFRAGYCSGKEIQNWKMA